MDSRLHQLKRRSWVFYLVNSIFYLIIFYLLKLYGNNGFWFEIYLFARANSRRWTPEFWRALRWIMPLNKEPKSTGKPRHPRDARRLCRLPAFHKGAGSARFELIIRKRERILFGARFVRSRGEDERRERKREQCAVHLIDARRVVASRREFR